LSSKLKSVKSTHWNESKELIVNKRITLLTKPN